MAVHKKERQFDLSWDLTIMVIVLVVSFVLSIIFDAFEMLNEWLRYVEYIEIDELFTILPIFTIMLLWYQTRRIQLMKSVLIHNNAKKKELEDRVRLLEKELKEAGQNLRKEKALTHQLRYYQSKIRPTEIVAE